MYLPRTHAITPTYILKHKGTYTCRRLREQIIQKNTTSLNQMGRGRNFKTPTKTARKTRQHKRKTRLKVTHCICMLKRLHIFSSVVLKNV